MVLITTVMKKFLSIRIITKGKSKMYTLLIAIIYLAFVSLGLPDSLLGSAWPIMHQEINASISFMGAIYVIVSLSTIASSLLSHRLTKKFGTKWVTTISVFVSAIALLGFSYCKSIWSILVFAIPYGLGAGGIDAALNNYVAIHYNSKHMSWLHCFWGVGTIISPFVMSYSLSHSSWNVGYRIISLVQICIGVVLLFSTPLWKVNENNTISKEKKSNSLTIIEALKIKGVPTLLTGFFAYCATESTAIAWSCTYLVEAKNIPEATAAALASSFFIGITFGRFLGGFIMDKFGDRKMILMGTCILLIGILLMLVPSSNITLSLIGLIVCGLGCAPIYPCIMHSTPKNFGTENSGAIIGIQMACAYLGSTIMSPLFGVIGKLLGFGLFPIYILLFAVLMLIMLEKTFELTNSGRNL